MSPEHVLKAGSLPASLVGILIGLTTEGDSLPELILGVRGGFRSDVCVGKGGVEPVEGMITVRKWKIPAQGKNPIEVLGQGWDQKERANFCRR